MISEIRVQRYKSLYDVTVKFSPLTVLIGPNGSGKSNICEAVFFLSKIVSYLEGISGRPNTNLSLKTLDQLAHDVWRIDNFEDKLWRGESDSTLHYSITTSHGQVEQLNIPSEFVELPIGRTLANAVSSVKIYDFDPTSIANTKKSTSIADTRKAGPATMDRSGQGVANALADILLDNRDRFAELESRLIELVPNISRIILERKSDANSFALFLEDKSSKYRIPSTGVSDGTLRILAFLTALYDVDSPRIVCFEEPENGIHPWLLNQVISLLNLVSTDGIWGRPVQVIVTTHSPALLNYLDPSQIRAVELSTDRKTLVHPLPEQGDRFSIALEVYDGKLGELWFTNIFGGNPS